MAGKKESTQFTHWRRPAPRMYHYNYEVAESYYKPQIKYMDRSSTRNLEPPGAQTFMERWAADPFYGRTESVTQLRDRGLVRASSVPQLLDDASLFDDIQKTAEDIRQSRSRCRSISRERSVSVEREESVDRVIRGRSRSRSPSRCPSHYYEPNIRGRSEVRAQRDFDDYMEQEYYSTQELDQLSRMAAREERESSIFHLRQALEDPISLAKKVAMKTTVGPGSYTNTLYGTELWAPVPRVERRRIY